MSRTEPTDMRHSMLGKGDSVLVTGASSGLGREIALHLAERGLRVYATTRTLARGHEVEAEAAQRGTKLDVLQLDITDQRGIESVVATVVSQCGSIAALVNNAGIAMRGYFEDCDDTEIREIFETNVFGSMALTRAVLPHMRRAGRGRVVIITSVAGLLGSMAMSAYCASKFALEGFGESLAQEIAPLGIHVSMIEPAMIKTPVWDGNRRYGRRARNDTSPYARWFRESERLVDELLASSTTSADDVAKAVFDRLTSSRPPLRCVVGRRARRIFMLRRVVPEEWFDRLYLREAVRRVASNEQRGGRTA